ncbi:LANO_0C07184g1_1 [Lachancea nothofagi CBS 11611]|uniref:RNA exonuclease 3 n=1 Tax=Lachancea nothofagi CBS 11611 TaxID=1266666 RepID=A0A1G4J8K9_9SACH|nr:LANO_0C07184g1_1 [Lachancea nothofagi CBS 11611]
MGLVRPVDLKVQPVPYQVRYEVLQKIVKTLERFESASGDTGRRAVEMEASVARKSGSGQSYRFNASVLLRDLLKTKGKLPQESAAGGRVKRVGTTIKLTRSDAMRLLEGAVVDEAILAENGYNTGKLEREVEDLQLSSAGHKYTSCIRCNTKFDRLQIMSPATCRFHVQRKRYNRDTREGEYACCGETTSSTSFLALGCKTLPHHVFRSETFDAMSQISPFKSTADIQGDANVLALDCEMAFTSLGYELIRLTVVDFFTSKLVFDEIVRPFGEVIDLNSEFSGVHAIEDHKSITFAEMLTQVLSKSMINGNSILIGHGMENDLNVLRLIHRKVIDTAILYPRGKFKSSLKDLAFEVVSKRIQSGEHDSSEDAIATMCVLKAKLEIPLSQTIWD